MRIHPLWNHASQRSSPPIKQPVETLKRFGPTVRKVKEIVPNG